MDRVTIDLIDGEVQSSDNLTEVTQPIDISDRKRVKREESSIWEKYEKKVDPITKKLRAYCKTCTKSYAIGDGGSSHGTRNLHTHEKSCPGLMNQNVTQMHLDHKGKMHNRKVSQLIYRDKMAEAIMMHNYSFLIVEHEGLRRVHNYLNPDVKSYTRNTAKADCIKIYKLKKVELKRAFENIHGRICLTSDLWSSGTSEGYICLTAHFIDNDFVLHSRIINFCHFPPPHNGTLLSEKIFEFLKDWGIEKKIFSITLDNATNNDNMQNFLKAHLRGNLLCNGSFFHVRCSAHILNLIVQDGLKIASEPLRKIRESVKYIKGSESRLLKFVACCEQLHVSVQSGLRLDCVTRWNSTWEMLNCVIKFKDVFFRYAMVESTYTTCPSNEEWEIAQAITTFLKPCWKITELFSGTSYPTTNVYFLHVSKIKELLMFNKFSEIEVIRNMTNEIMPKFDKYWNDYVTILSIAIILDPRYKVQFVKFKLKKVETDENEINRKVDNILNVMKSLFVEYVTEYSKDGSQQAQDGARTSTIATINTSEHSDDEFDEFVREVQGTTSTRTELEQYLEEKMVSNKSSFNILEEWKKLSERYPILAKMTYDILSIPITTVASESAFSVGAKFLTKYRSSLLPDNAQALICGRNWICGYEIQDDGPTDDQLLVPLVANQESKGSNVAEI